MKKKAIAEQSWILYDAGNSAFVLVMVTAIMPLFFKQYAAADLPDAVSTANWGFANSTASFILAMLSPILGSLADYKQRKVSFFAFFLCIGLFFTFCLALITQGQWLLCLGLFVAARVGWAGANVFYDALLVDVSPPERMDRVSARGYGYGYIGSVIPFIAVIGLVLSAGLQGSTLPPDEVKIGFVIVGVWWLLLSIPTLCTVRQVHALPAPDSPLKESFSRLYQTIKHIRQHRQVFIFLLAYFFYIDGVGTIISMSTAYGYDLGFDSTLLIAVLLYIQVVAFPFALLYGKLAAHFSARNMLLAGIAVYSLVTLLAFFLPSLAGHGSQVTLFWIIATMVASSMGGIQALSRSYFAKLIPADQSAEFFGFYNVFGKFAAISGPLLMGIVARLTGETRWGILSILLLFVLGGFILYQTDKQ
ncbi:MFS transporter [Desulfogranum japonicum]|uniref:MFS transporter n=1 Tax=Desulfogranum japonicum TaxID=231447 RepID=UPI00040DBB88|nr:MFS transporter [Desulfogranum japonicum]